MMTKTLALVPLPLVLLPLFAAVWLAGCSLAPSYQRPAAPVPDQWPAQKLGADGTAGSAAVASQKLVSDDWRGFFAEAALQELIAAALEHNRDLKIAAGRVAEARALSGISGADRLPSIDLGTQRQASRTPGDLSASGRALSSQRYDINLGTAAFELDFWGRLQNLDAAARANFLASEYAQRSFRLTLVSDVATAYYTLRELEQRSALAAATQQSREESRKLIEKRRDVGLAGDMDFFAADGAWQVARAETANLVRQQAAAENALRLLTGTATLAGVPAQTAPVAPLGQAAVAPAPSFPAPAEIRVDLPSEVLLRRPDVLAAEQRLIGAHANIGAARAAFFPRISLTAVAGTASHLLSGLFAAGSGAWSFVPLLKLPLFDGGRAAGNVDLAEARKNIAVAEYEKAIQQAFREVADLLAARERYAEQLQALDAAQTAQRERLLRVDARYRAGVSSYLELLDAQRELYAAQQAALTTRRALATTAASLYKALGGG